jgi:multicomponent Na+:H+ antiporter subunit G
VRTALASFAVLAGAAFMFVAGLGVARFPDLYTRMHAATKPAGVGVVALMAGVALAHWDAPVTARAGLVALFFLLTAPVAAHAIARSAHTRRVPLAPGTRVDGAGEARERSAGVRGRGDAAAGGAEHRGRAAPDGAQRPPDPATYEEDRP